jgi:hypothetical protein
LPRFPRRAARLRCVASKLAALVPRVPSPSEYFLLRSQRAAHGNADTDSVFGICCFLARIERSDRDCRIAFVFDSETLKPCCASSASRIRISKAFPRAVISPVAADQSVRRARSLASGAVTDFPLADQRDRCLRGKRSLSLPSSQRQDVRFYNSHFRIGVAPAAHAAREHH